MPLYHDLVRANVLGPDPRTVALAGREKVISRHMERCGYTKATIIEESEGVYKGYFYFRTTWECE